MSFRKTDTAHVREIDLAAAEWLVKRDRGLTPEEQDDLSQWLATDPRHGEWLARHQQTWKEFNLLGEWRPEHSLEPNPDLLARPRAIRRWVAPIALAAAACVALVFVAGHRWRTENARAEVPGSSAIAVAPSYLKRTLEDGSVVELNRGAAIDVRYTAAERHVYLVSGEAYFTVAKNHARPFFVHGGPIAVRAVGTAFNVRLESDKMEVLVTEGRVEVKPTTSTTDQAGIQVANQIPLLIAGQLAVVSLDPKAEAPQVTAVTPQDMARLLAWQPQMLDFSSTPLASVVAEFNRRNHTQIVLEDTTLGELPIVASFRSDSIDAFVRLLEVTAGVRAERRGEDTIVLHSAPVSR